MPPPSATTGTPYQVISIDASTVERQALDYFITNMVASSNVSGSRGDYQDFLEVLPILCAQSNPPSALASAMSALALATFTAGRATNDYDTQARLRYGEALMRQHDGLKAVTRDNCDEALATTFLFGLIEVRD